MIKYCFCFFLCVLTINGAYDGEEAGGKTNKIVLRSQPSSSCLLIHPFFTATNFDISPNTRITTVYFAPTMKPIYFGREIKPDDNNICTSFNRKIKLAGYLYKYGILPQINILVESDVAKELANLSEPILQLLSLETSAPGQKFRLNSRSRTDRNLMNLALSLSQGSLTTQPDATMSRWKMNALLNTFEELWSHLSTEKTSEEKSTKRNQILRKMLTMVVDPFNVFEYEEFFKRNFPALVSWGNSNNTSGKPVGAVITILLMLACTEWQAPPPVPTLILPFQVRNSTSFTNIASFTNNGCMMSSRRAALLEKRKESQNTNSSDGPPSIGFSNAYRRAKLYDEMRNNRKSTMPRSPSEGTPSPFSSTFSLLPTIDAADTDGFYIGDNDDSDDDTV